MEIDRPRARDSVENLLCFCDTGEVFCPVTGRDIGFAADAGEVDGCMKTEACGASVGKG